MTDTYLGLDVSHWNPEPLPWLAWRDRVRVVGIKLTDGVSRDWQATAHIAAVRAAGYNVTFGYHYIEPGLSGAAQAAAFLAALEPGFTFAVLDVEEPGLTEFTMRTFCDTYDAHEVRALVLYGNSALLSKLIAANPGRYAKYGVLWAEYGPNTPTSTPPYDHPHPTPGLRLVGWQYSGKGILPPYTQFIDLSQWYEIPGGTPPAPPVDTTGLLVAAHAAAIKGLVV